MNLHKVCFSTFKATLMITHNIYFSTSKAIPMSTRNICFYYGEIWKIIPKLSSNEPSHENMVLFILGKLKFQMCMRSHPVGLDV